MGGLGRTIRTPPTASAPRCWGIYRAAQRIIHVRPPTVQVAPTLTQNTHTTSNTCGPNAGGKPPADGLARAFPDGTEAHVPRRSKNGPIRAGRLERDVRRQGDGPPRGPLRTPQPHLCAARRPTATTQVSRRGPAHAGGTDVAQRPRPPRRTGHHRGRAGRFPATDPYGLNRPRLHNRCPASRRGATTADAWHDSPADQPPPTRAGRQPIHQTRGDAAERVRSPAG